MATYNADKALDQFPAPSASVQGDVKANRGFIDLAVTGALADADVVNLAKVPAQHVLVDAYIDTAELDTGTAIVLDIDLYDPVGDNSYAVITGSTVGQAGGVARLDLAAALGLAPIDNDMLLRATVATAPTTGTTSGKLAGTVLYRGAESLDS